MQTANMHGWDQEMRGTQLDMEPETSGWILWHSDAIKLLLVI